MLAVGGVEAAGEDAGGVAEHGHGAVDALERCELLHEPLAAERVLALAAEGDAGGGVGNVGGVELDGAAWVVDANAQELLGPRQAQRAGSSA